MMALDPAVLQAVLTLLGVLGGFLLRHYLPAGAPAPVPAPSPVPAPAAPQHPVLAALVAAGEQLLQDVLAQRLANVVPAVPVSANPTQPASGKAA